LKNPNPSIITKEELEEFEVKKRRISVGVDEINTVVEYYKNMESELKNIGSSKNDIIENWFNCLIRLNNKPIIIKPNENNY